MRKRRRAFDPMTGGKVVGTRKSGISLAIGYEGTVDLRVGNLEVRSESGSYSMDHKEAATLGLALFRAAARAEIERTRRREYRQAVARRERQRLLKEVAAMAEKPSFSSSQLPT